MAAPKSVHLAALKTLREETGAPIGEIRAALESSGGDERKARELLRARGASAAAKRQDRATGQGRIEAYIHHDGRMGALIEVDCETDFVARTAEFAQLCRDLAMQVAAMAPRYVRADEVPADIRASREELKQLCLLEQPFVKDQSSSVHDLLKALVAKTGENIVVRRFPRFMLGEALPS